ncbi:MAG: LysM peptidoglycan-binding domain-containing protein [Anaerolineaceae bacterium]|nr:LysM peptidoglycan-binding domain-containing protein [Anaerolineaceae bacterium]
MRNVFRVLLIAANAAVFLIFSVKPVKGQAWSAYDLINAVNELRASYGLAPYQVDGSLTSIAQGHSEYMASIGTFTHTRQDGSAPGDHGITAENIGGGLNASPQYLVNSQWADELHTRTMIGFTEGLAGAGVAEQDGVLYYTLAIKNTGQVSSVRPVAATGNPGSTSPQPSQAPIRPMQTVSPQEDGSIVHVIEPGQTLWNIAIAYGVKIADLTALNPGLSAENPIVYPGQKIIIRLAFTRTPSPYPSETPIPPTRTPNTTFTPRPTRTSTIAPTETPPPLLPEIPSLGSSDSRALGIAVVAASALGLLAVLITILRGGRKNPEE